nr:ATP-binding cassette domain-containing protein [Peterkaempfera griseoplana]
MLKPEYRVPSHSVMFGGPGSGAHVSIDDPSVAREHAKALCYAGQWVVVAKKGPVYVDGRSVRQKYLPAGSHFILGQTTLTVPDSSNPQPNEWFRLDPGLQVSRLTVKRKGEISLRVKRGVSLKREDRILLAGTSFTVNKSELAVIVGPSGSGKTTLLNVILGSAAPDVGEVRVFGQLVAAPGDPASPAMVIHSVPQETSLHKQLSIRSTLRYAAALREREGQSRYNRNIECEILTERAGIAQRAKAPVCELSGGERRRLSLAVELAADPNLLILDEPGSGLDAGHDRAMMETLKNCTKRGTTVVCVTHNVSNLNFADRLIVLAHGGVVVYNGRPGDALPALKSKLSLTKADWPDVMYALARRPLPCVSEQRQRHPRHAPRTKPLKCPLGTWLWLSRRQFWLTLLHGREASKHSILKVPFAHLWVAALPALGAYLAVLSAKSGWQNRSGDTDHLIALLATVAALTGASLTYSDLVNEARVVDRENRIGVSGLQVVSAKLTVVAFHTAALTSIMVAVYSWKRMMGNSYALQTPGPVLGMAITIYLVMLSSAAAGLLISAFSINLHKAVTLVTALAIMQVALNNVLFDLPALLQRLTIVLPARVGVAAQAAYLAQPRNSGSPDWLWTHSQHIWFFDEIILVTLAVGFAVAAGIKLDYRCRKVS